MDRTERNFWGHYLTRPSKHDKESYSYIRYNDLNEQELVLEDLDEKSVDDLVTDIQYLSTPGEDGYHLFGTMSSELSLLKKSLKRVIRKSLFRVYSKQIFFWAYLGIQLMDNTSHEFGIYTTDVQLLLIALILIPLLNALISLIEIRKIKLEDISRRFEYRRFKNWLRQGEYISHFYLPLVIGIFYCWQYGSGDNPIELFGLTKPFEDLSSYYKLFTVVLVHANFPHVILNLILLSLLSNLFLRFASYKRLLVVFFTAVLVSSLFSVLLIPSGTSVGASGGSIGLLGFVLAISIKSRTFIPQKFTLRLLFYTGIAATLGFSTWEAIDNAAHLGGMVAGIILGFLYSEKLLLKKLDKDYQEELEKNKNRLASLTEKFEDMAQKESDFSKDTPPALR
ncbi:MAG: rhomboid family intramembrane serine protease [Roseivirga sp.]|nr:rhomboid family intramembrane serine protease [Roseivirga sp.]